MFDIMLSKRVLAFSLGVSLIFPVMLFFLLGPAVNNVLVTETKEEAFRLADHIQSSFNVQDRIIKENFIDDSFLKEIEGIQKQFDLYKISIINGTGEVVFSTNDNDLGIIQNDDFFKNIVATGKKYAIYKPKGSVSLEGIPLTADVVETYLPLVREGRFIGSIEIYYDITEAKNEYEKLKSLFSVILFAVALFVMIAMAVVSSRAEKSRLGQVEAEDKLSKEQLKAEAIFAAMGDSIVVQDLDFRIIYQNHVNLSMFGDRRGEICYKVYEGKDSICEFCPVVLTFKDGLFHKAETSLSTDGGVRYFDLVSSPLKDNKGNIVAGVKVIRDITEQKNSEEALRRSEKRNKALLSAMPDMMMLLNREGEILDYKKPKQGDIFNYPAGLTGKRISALMPPDIENKFLEAISTALQNDEIQSFDYKLANNMELRNYEARIVRSGQNEAIAILRDITEHRALEEQLRHSQKMESLGILTGGISHEFNNILSGIMGFGELLHDEMNENDPLIKYVDMINISAKRAEDLTKGLLAYSRKQVSHKELVSLNKIIRNMKVFLTTLIGVDIRLDIQLSSDDPKIMADSNQIEQIMINLAANARDAMPDGGSLTISTDTVMIDEKFIRTYGYGETGRYALINVVDTGTGIDEKTQEKIFEPFFTTKDIGKGTGLGLSVVYGIVKSHGGYIRIKSARNEGTTFKIYLPV